MLGSLIINVELADYPAVQQYLNDHQIGWEEIG